MPVGPTKPGRNPRRTSRPSSPTPRRTRRAVGPTRDSSPAAADYARRKPAIDAKRRGPGGPTRDTYPAEVEYKENRIVRGQSRPTRPTSNDPAQQRRYRREKRIYGRGKNARQMLQVPVGDPRLDKIKHVPSHVVRDSAIVHINETIRKIDSQIAKTPEIDTSESYPAKMSPHDVARHNLKIQELRNTRSHLQAQRSSLKTRRIIGTEKKVKKTLGTKGLSRGQRGTLVKAKGKLRKQELRARERTKRLKDTSEKFKQQAKDTRDLAEDQGGSSFKNKASAFAKGIPESIEESAKGVLKTGTQTAANYPSSLLDTGNPFAALGLATGKTAVQDPKNTALTAATVIPIEDLAFGGGRILGGAGRLALRRAGRTIPARIAKASKGAIDKATLRRATQKEAETLLAPSSRTSVEKELYKNAQSKAIKDMQGRLVSKAERSRLVPPERPSKAAGEPATVSGGSTPRKGLGSPQKRSEGPVPTRDIDKKVQEIRDYEATMKSRLEIHPSVNPKARAGMVTKKNRLYKEFHDMLAQQVAGTDRFIKAPTVAAYKAAKKTISGVPLHYEKYRYPVWVAGGTTAVGAGYDLTVKKGHEVTKIYRDTRDLMAGFPYAMYVTGEAAFKLAQGDTTEVEQLWKSIKDTDPVALAVQGKFDEALRVAENRPVTAGLSVLGWGSLAGRVPGVGARAVGGLSGYVPVVTREGLTTQLEGVGRFRGIGISIGHAGSQRRAPLPILEDETGAVVHRRYSPNLAVKGAQVASERLGKRKLSERELVARKQLAGQADIRNDVAIFDLSSRAKVGDAEAGVHKIFDKLSGKIRPNVRGGEEAFYLVATKMLRSPDTAVEDLNTMITKYKAMQETAGARSTVQRGKLIENLEALRDSDVASDPKIWNAVEEFRKQESIRQKELVDAGLLDQKQADAAPWINYFTHHMGGEIRQAKNGEIQWILPKGNKAVGSLGEKIGTPLTLAEVKAYAKDNGVTGEPIHIAARDVLAEDEGNVAIGAYANEIHSGAELVRDGKMDITADSIIRQAVRGQRNIDKASFMRHLLSRYGEGKQDGAVFASNKAALDYYHRFEDRFVHEMVPMPVRLKEGEINSKLLDVAPFEDLTKTIENSLEYKGKGKFVLVPRFLKDELQKFVDVENSSDTLFRKLNREFKGSVLPFSPKWHFGNLMDMSLRLFMEGVTPLDWARGRKLMSIVREHDENLYHELLAQVGGGHLSAAARSVVDRGALPMWKVHQLSAGQFLMRYLVPFKGPNRAGLVGRVYRDAQRGSFKLSHYAEIQYRAAALGKHQTQLLDQMGRNWFKSFAYGGKTMEDMVKLLEDTNNMKMLGKSTVDTLGDYTNMSPAMRRAVNTYLPFGLWLRASAKWILTLPYNHPIKTGFFAAVNKTTEDERKRWGLYLDKQAKRVLPAFMFGSIPSYGDKNEVWLFRTQQYTSFGPYYDYLDSGLNFILPQLQGPFDIMRGYDWTGKEIVNKDGTPLSSPQRIGLALSNMTETMLYPLNLAHRLIVHGSPSNRSAALAEIPAYRNLFNLVKPEIDWYRKGDFPGAKIVTDEPSSLLESVSHWGNPGARTKFGFSHKGGEQNTSTPKSLLDSPHSTSTHDSLFVTPKKKKQKTEQSGSLLN